MKKLTINDIPEGYNYAAIDSSGNGFAYQGKPKKLNTIWVVNAGMNHVLIGKFDPTDWQNSLVSRETTKQSKPKTLTSEDIPEAYSWAAVEPDGVAYAYEVMPKLSADYNSWESSEGSDYKKIGENYDASNWKKSLIWFDKSFKVFFDDLTIDDIPKGYNYIAIDSWGSVYAYINEPEQSYDHWGKVGDEVYKQIGVHVGEFDWEESLICRHSEKEFKTLTVKDIPEGFNHAVVTEIGVAIATEIPPRLTSWGWDFSKGKLKRVGYGYDFSNWPKSMVSREGVKPTNPHPKTLTVHDLPEGFNYGAVNSDGYAFAFKDVPILLERGYGVNWNTDHVFAEPEPQRYIGSKFDTTNWKSSFVMREEKKTVEYYSFENTFLEVAEVIAKRSKSTRLKVGAVLVKDKRIISTGYNGLVSGVEPDVLEDENGVTKKEVIHAELNCIISCARNGVSCEGSTLYLTHSPCQSCAALIAQSGIKKVIFKNDYRDSIGINKLGEYGVKVIKLN